MDSVAYPPSPVLPLINFRANQAEHRQWQPDRMTIFSRPVGTVRLLARQSCTLFRAIRAPDAALLILLFMGAAVLAWLLTGIHDHIAILRNVKSDDVWFQADSRPAFSSMTDRYRINRRADIHPLFRLFAITFTYCCKFFLRLDNLNSVRLMIASAAGAWVALFYSLLRLLGCRRPDSVVFAIVAATSAAAIFWTAVPETYLFGSLTIVAVLVTAALAERRAIPPWLDITVAAASLSVLVTNWMFALASLVTRYKIRTAIKLAGGSLIVVALLFAIERLFIHSATYLPSVSSTAEQVFLFRARPITTLVVFFLHAMVMPDIKLLPNGPDWPMFSIQHSFNWNLTAWGNVALAAWIILLLAGGYAMVSLQRLNRFRLMLVIALVGQLALHLVYGEETFLYTMNWMPLLVAIAALATLTRLRWVVLPTACLLFVSASQHNYAELKLAFDTLASNATLSP